MMAKKGSKKQKQERMLLSGGGIVGALVLAGSKKQKQERMMLLIGGGIVSALVLAGVVIFLVQSSANVAVCKIDDKDCYGVYLEVEQGKTENGIPYIGSMEARVIVAEFGDFACPHCAEFHPIAERIIRDFAHNGEVRFEYRPMSFLAAPYSDTSAQAALCAGEQGAFWQFHTELFEIQEAESYKAFTQDRLARIAKDMGLDDKALKTCMNSNIPRAAMAYTDASAQRLGVEGTPAIYYSLDNGGTWTKINADYSSISAIIRQANASS